jgi:hypothetical protein
MSAPEVSALDRTEVAVPQEEGLPALGIVGDVGGQCRVPPRIPSEGADWSVGGGIE